MGEICQTEKGRSKLLMIQKTNYTLFFIEEHNKQTKSFR